MGTTFIVLPDDENGRARLTALIGNLEHFFPDQLKVHDALALEASTILMDGFCKQLAVQLFPLQAAQLTPTTVDSGQSEQVIKTIPETIENPPLIFTSREIPRVCLECGQPIDGPKHKKYCSKKCSMKVYWRRHEDQKRDYNRQYRKKRSNGNDGKDKDFVQVRKYRIMSSGKEVEDISHLLESHRLVVGEVIRHIDGKRYQVIERDTGKLALEHLWSFTQ